MKSFNALIFAGCFVISVIILGVSGIVPITTQTVFVGIVIFVVIICYAFMLRKIENARDRWKNNG